MRALAVGEYDVRGIAVLCQSDEVVAANPVFLRAVGAQANGAPVRLTVKCDREQAYARQPFKVLVRLEVDARVNRVLTASTARFVFPWWESVVAVSDEAALLRDQRRYEIERAHRSVNLELQRGTIEKDGVFYEVLVGEIVVLAPEPGVLTLAGSGFRCEIPPSSSATPPMHGAAGRRSEALSAPHAIAIRPLPEEGRPPGWGDAVGDFEIAAEASRASLRVGDPLGLTVTIREVRSQCSNVAFARFPGLNEIAGFRVFSESAARAPGERVFRFEVSPETAAVRAVPSFTIHWFDPEEERYQSASSAPLPLEVKPHPAGLDLAGETPAAEQSPSAWRWPLAAAAALLAAFLGAALALAGRRLRLRLRLRSGAARPQERARQARAELERSLRDAAGAAPEDELAAARAFARYLAARCDAEAGRCFGAGAAEVLRARGVEEALCADVARFFAAAEERVFGRRGGESDGAASVRGLVERLEEGPRRPLVS
ncbi:MAG: BatD family protein [Planctomycetes bacterium]|nr:BatD family protein [Planctomycetota bacterium]